jgi:hypothetical protein
MDPKSTKFSALINRRVGHFEVLKVFSFTVGTKKRFLIQDFFDFYYSILLNQWIMNNSFLN